MKPVPSLTCTTIARSARRLSIACLAVVSIAGPGAQAIAAPSVGVAAFENDVAAPFADLLADAMATRELDRLLRPGSFVATPGVEPSAAVVREWAYAAAVDALVLGRVTAATEGRPARLVVVVRSGHSGAERARHVLDVPAPALRTQMLDDLAGEILAGLGYVAPISAPTNVAAAPADTPRTESASGRGLDAALDLEGFDGDAPIEIKADEAEIVSGDHGRELVFQRNVHVKQANVTLRSERLEASYERGESEPERLVAQGKVFVAQGGRQAKCDRAVYVRKEQQLTCSGRAELVQGCDIVRGDSIQFWLADDRARVQGAASIVILPEQKEGAGCPNAGGRS